MKMNVHIERLILEGLPVGSDEGSRVRAAVIAEMQRLIGIHGISPELRSGGMVPAIRADAMQISKKGSPGQLGTQIARAVYGGLRRPE
jgi:hypothetical protein